MVSKAPAVLFIHMQCNAFNACPQSDAGIVFISECAHECRYDSVAKLGITASKQHLQATFPDGIPLDTAFVSPSVIHQLDASAEDAVTSGLWCDLQALLPPTLTHEDTAAVLEHCSVMQSSGELQTSLCSMCMQF